MFPNPKLLFALIALGLGGCASQQKPLPLLDMDRIAGLERAIKATDEASQARDAALNSEIDSLKREVKALAAAVKDALALASQENIRINGKEAFSVLLTEDKTLYPINSPELGSQDVAKLDDLVGRLAKLDQDYHLEIQGHTDNIGTEDYNYELGKARADVVKRFLHEKRAISLSRMSVISFGAGSPADRNSSHNRRIAIRVLVLK